jgi:hypothetical protein
MRIVLNWIGKVKGCMVKLYTAGRVVENGSHLADIDVIFDPVN